MEKEFHLQEYAIVVAGSNHNPTILNPDFLERRKIVPESWKIEKALTTDNLSQVQFDNKFVITVEPRRIVFLHYNPAELTDTTLENVSIAYVKTLPEATYTAIGINLKGIVPFLNKEEAEKFISKTVLSKGPWQDIHGGLKFGTVTLVYVISGGRLNLSIEPAEFGTTGIPTTTPVNAITANFHRELPEDHNKAAIEMEKIIKNWENDKNCLEESMIKLFSRE